MHSSTDACRPTGESATTDADIDALLQALRQRHPDGDVTLVQTHISWLLMAGERVWKIKKPVHLPFADFRTLAQRKHLCEEELRLNRRFAPELYLGLRPLWRDAQGALCWEEASAARGPVEEWAVEMRRFPADALLRTRIEAGDARIDAALHTLGVQLAQFHAQASAENPDPRYGSAGLIQAEVEQVLRTLGRGPLAAKVPAWRDWVHAQNQRLVPLWQARQQRVREVHGDLHLGNLVVMTGQRAAEQGEGVRITPFDGIEFQPAMRWLDPVNDVAFLSMDLHAHGRSDLAAWLMDGWLQSSGDFEGLGVWRFYEVYRALVRAMVATLSPGEDAAQQAARYVRLIDGWTVQPETHQDVQLRITCGLSGSGKSTVAGQIMQTLGAVRIRSDVERKRLFGLAALQDSRASGLDIYTPEAGERTFARLAELAEAALRQGWSVVVDAAFLRQSQRQIFLELAQRLGLPFAIVHCQAPPDILRQRIHTRQQQGQDPSEASADLIALQQQWMEPFTAQESAYVMEVPVS